MTLFNMKRNNILKIVLCIVIGIIIGGYLFSDTQPRSLLAVHKCEQTCLKPQELLGLANSVNATFFTVAFAVAMKIK